MYRKISLILCFVLCVSVFGQKKLSLKNFPQDKVMVVAHRGDWRDAPENSLWAVKKAIEKGANMVEIDLAMTKDSVLILMHDRTLDRTTTGTGKPSDFTLKEIQKLRLRDGLGMPTDMEIPTLEQVLKLAKGKVFLNLDKAFDYLGLVHPLVVKYEMQDEVLYKGNATYEEFNQKYASIKDSILFMPIIRLERGQADRVAAYMQHYTPYGFEFTTGETEAAMIDFSNLRKQGKRVWGNALWKIHNAGHHDDMALENPDVYQWYLKHHINIIQTDRIKELVDFLKRKKLYWKK